MARASRVTSCAVFMVDCCLNHTLVTFVIFFLLLFLFPSVLRKKKTFLCTKLVGVIRTDESSAIAGLKMK